MFSYILICCSLRGRCTTQPCALRFNDCEIISLYLITAVRFQRHIVYSFSVRYKEINIVCHQEDWTNSESKTTQMCICFISSCLHLLSFRLQERLRWTFCRCWTIVFITSLSSTNLKASVNAAAAAAHFLSLLTGSSVTYCMHYWGRNGMQACQTACTQARKFTALHEMRQHLKYINYDDTAWFS